MDTEVIIAGKGIAGLVVSLLLKRKSIPHLLLDRSDGEEAACVGGNFTPVCSAVASVPGPVGSL